MIYSAVVVTLNRLNLLKLCLEKLQNQTHKLDYIVIVDNKSTDGTIEFLKTIESDQIKVIYNEKNEGGAGGFYRGLKAAYDLGSDYFWIMDDDTIASPNALEELINAFDVLADEQPGFITSNVLYKDGKPCYMNISGTTPVWNEHLSDGLIRVSHSSFVSMMISRLVMEDVGLPFKDFFIWGDDGEYSTRIALKYPGYISAKSVVYHYMGENKGVDILNTPKDRIGRFYYFYRNWMFTNKFRDEVAAKNYEKEIIRFSKYLKKQKITDWKEKVAVIKKGLKDGKKMVAKIDFPQGTESQEGVKPLSAKQKFKRWVKARILKVLKKFDEWTDHKLSHTKVLYKMDNRVKHSKFYKIKFLLKGLFRCRLYDGKTKGEAFNKLMKAVHIDVKNNDRFLSSIDIYKCWWIYYREMDNCPPDYDLFINNSLYDLKFKQDSLTDFGKDNNLVIDGIITFVKRAIKKVSHSSHKNKKNIVKWLNSFLNGKAEGVEDALQRVIIINQLLWQTGHKLVGYGRLDLLLDDALKNDESLSDESLRDILADFFKAQHNYYTFKSSALMGDTGQIVILGGNMPDGTYFQNRLTTQFIKAIEKIQLPDPKVLLRVSNKTPKELWDVAIQCASTGVGCPLFSNDDRVVPALIDFGYDKLDAYHYTTSACWEPIPANSYEQNNISFINFAEAFDLISRREDLTAIKSFDEYVEKFIKQCKKHAWYMADLTKYIIWEADPFMSACSKHCREKQVDISKGGGKYNNYGVLSIGMSNSINSLMNIKKYVFEDKVFTLKEIDKIRRDNYENNEDVLNLFKNSAKSFGKDDEYVIKLTNRILDEVDKYLSSWRNCFDGKVKFGLSSPSYLEIGKISNATFDGRRKGEPYGTHISADFGVAYTELMSFAAKLKYDGAKFNGNVVDIMLSPDFINNNKEKFAFFMEKNIKEGVFQLQLNVVSSETLIKAKADPTFMPNLIVRVWGFSAYFNELPEEYQNMLIERAKRNESTYN